MFVLAFLVFLFLLFVLSALLISLDLVNAASDRLSAVFLTVGHLSAKASTDISLDAV
jgi:hypothetical protein